MCSEPSNLKGIYNNNSTVKMLKYRSKSSLPDTSFILFFYETIVLFTLQLVIKKLQKIFTTRTLFGIYRIILYRK